MDPRTKHWVGGAALMATSMLLAQMIAEPLDVVLYNGSPSIPVGFYMRSSDVPGAGAIVTVRAREVAPDYANLRQFTDPGDRFIKRVAASGGDQVCAQADDVFINGHTAAHRAHSDATGRVLPRWEDCRTLRENELFLLGDTGNSFDSRHFGPVSTDDIEGVWRPLF